MRCDDMQCAAACIIWHVRQWVARAVASCAASGSWCAGARHARAPRGQAVCRRVRISPRKPLRIPMRILQGTMSRLISGHYPYYMKEILHGEHADKASEACM